MFVQERFELDPEIIGEIYSLKSEFGYNGFGEFVFYRTYSRIKADGYNETWNDVIKRVTEGIFSIRKDFYIKNRIEWDESYWQCYSRQFALSMFHMKWLPSGRGLWMCGTDFVYEHGSMALTNCAATLISSDIGSGIHWLMDLLMLGVGVSFQPTQTNIRVYPHINVESEFYIPDSREGWCDSTKALIDSYLTPASPSIEFNYSGIRGPGLPIKGFGGLSSGPAPLIELHNRIREYFKMYCGKDWYSITHLKTDIANAVGACVVSGNVRRSAELALGSINDLDFLDLKDYTINPYRSDIGYMSNNSVTLEDDADFEKLDLIAERVIKNGEPGFINLKNLAKGRIGKNDGLKPDLAIMVNPCGEQPLESGTGTGGEVCVLAETLPTRCVDHKEWLQAGEYATFYTSTVTLLPTHRPETNKIIARNRRIGVGIIDVTGWMYTIGVNQVIKYLREGYKRVRKVNAWLAAEAGIPESIRVTTIKPGGTLPKLAGRTAGIGYPNFRYMIRRVRVAMNSNVVPILQTANIPYEPDINDPSGTLIFEFPLECGPSKPSSEVTIWQQAMNVIMLQSEWSDNAVSNTLSFRKNEEEDIEAVISAIAPQVKSISLLPRTDEGIYPQMPESGISREEYQKRLSAILPIDWGVLTNNEAEPERFCTGEICTIEN